VKLAFAIGAAVFLSSVLFTIITTSEYPPEDMDEFKKEKEKGGLFHGLKAILENFVSMPIVMKKLGLVQFFSWFAFFTMWTYATPALTEHVFNAVDPASSEYQEAANLVSSYMGTYGLSSMAFALLLTFIAGKVRINRKFVHMGSLIIGGLGFIYMYFVKDHVMLQVSFACIGIAWGSILSMPYAMLSGSIDAKKMGLFMGLFNMFIVIPQIVAALGGINWAYKTLLGEATINTMILAGLSLILAGLFSLLITEKEAIK
jgi:maltose/moltooligosaccharide transporter